MTTVPAPAHHRAHDATERTSWWVLGFIGVAQFMVILDVTVVNIALPSISKALDFSATDLQWVVTVYVLFTGGLMLLGGRSADLLGRRRVFLVGLLVFTAASLASGLAWSSHALIVSRAAQGFGAALLLPSALAIITTTYSGAQRTAALAVWGAIGSAGVAIGVLLGGIITTAFGWEWIFFINVPVGIIVGVGAVRLVPAERLVSLVGLKLDLLGGITLLAGLMTLVYGVVGTAQHGWTSARTLLLLAVAAFLLAAFFAIERRGTRPLVPPATWRVRSLVSSAVVMLGTTGVLVGSFYLNTLYLQNVLGYSALKTGLSFLPLALVILAAAHASSHLLSHAGSRIVGVVGLVMTSGGALLLAVAPDRASYVTDLLPGFLLLGAGVGLVFVAVTVTAMADVGHAEAGLASGIMTTAHELGAALGVAVLAAVATSNGNPVSGYGDGFFVAAAIAALLAVMAAVVLPALRPAPGTHVSMH
jgi:EmrB/QacA subfamily drug resistance transporter